MNIQCGYLKLFSHANMTKKNKNKKTNQPTLRPKSKATTAALGLGRQKPRARGAITKRPDLFPGLLFPSITTTGPKRREEN